MQANLSIPTPKDITVRPAPNGQHYFNGLSSLEACVETAEPGFKELPRPAKKAILNDLKKKLSVAPPQVNVPTLFLC